MFLTQIIEHCIMCDGIKDRKHQKEYYNVHN